MRHALATPTARAEIRPWPLQPSIAHLVLLDVAMVPTAEHIERWLDDAFAGPEPRPRVLRTGALYPAAAAAFAEHDFVVVDRLALLERAIHPPARRSWAAVPGPAALRRARRRDLPTMAEIDQSTFAAGWQNDRTSLARISAATPRSHRRLAFTEVGGRRQPVGFAMTGLAGSTGYLQRLAVHPDARLLGIGAQLVADALRWLAHRNANRVLVNTGIDNVGALRLYESASFDVLDDQLVVLEHRRTP